MFADDLTTWTSGIDITTLEKRQTNLLNKIIDWNNHHNMFLSSKKGKYTTTLFTNNKKDRLPIINMNNITLQSTKYMKLLGITLDLELNMNQYSKIIKIEG